MVRETREYLGERLARVLTEVMRQFSALGAN